MKTARTGLLVHFLAALLLPFSPGAAFAQTDFYALQVASLSSRSAAETKVQQLQALGLDAYWLQADVPSKGVRYRVRIGRFETRAVARANGERLRAEGIAWDFLVTEYEPPQSVVFVPPAPADRSIRAAGFGDPANPSPSPTPAALDWQPRLAPSPAREAASSSADTAMPLPAAVTKAIQPSCHDDTGKQRMEPDCRPIASFMPARLVAWCALPPSR